jgi:hypothetical protein
MAGRPLACARPVASTRRRGDGCVKLIIKPHRPLRRALVIIGAGVAVLLALAVALDYGHWRAIAGAMVATGDRRALLEEVIDLRRENEKLRFALNRLQRAGEIDQTARGTMRESLVEREAEIAALEREVRFYRDVVGTAEVGAGPKIGGMRVKTIDGDGRYRYTLVMTYIDKDDRLAEGTVQVDLRGEQRGKSAALKFSQVVESGPETLAFKFKHFHLFEGTLRLPSDFQPRQIDVAVRGKGRSGSSHAETYDWSSVLN